MAYTYKGGLATGAASHKFNLGVGGTNVASSAGGSFGNLLGGLFTGGRGKSSSGGFFGGSGGFWGGNSSYRGASHNFGRNYGGYGSYNYGGYDSSNGLPDYYIDTSEAESTSDKIKTKFGLYFDRGQASTAFTTKFNKYNLPIPGQVLKSGRAYVFMTKPDFNLGGKQGGNKFINLITNANDADKEYISYSGYFSYLSKLPIWEKIKSYLDASNRSSSPFIPLVTNACFGYDPPDLTIKTEDGPDTFRGWKTMLARNSVESRKLPSFSLSFKLDNDLVAYHLVKAWFEAIELEDQGILHRKETYLEMNIVDYMASMFYVVVGEDGETILFISKITGCFPTKDPASVFSSNDAGSLDTGSQLKLNTDWQGIFYDTMNIAIIDDFNAIAEQAANNNLGESPIYLDPAENDYWGSTPVIIFDQTAGNYKLKWTDDGNTVSGVNLGKLEHSGGGIRQTSSRGRRRGLAGGLGANLGRGIGSALSGIARGTRVASSANFLSGFFGG